MRFRKKPVTQPVIIHAIRVVELDKPAGKLPAWIVSEFRAGTIYGTSDGNFAIGRGLAAVIAGRNDWIVRDQYGALYPCKPDIFAATYDAADDDATPDPATLRWHTTGPFVPKGWQLVPCLEGRTAWPPEMNAAADAFFAAYNPAGSRHGFYENFYAAWNAALAVLPKLPQAPDVVPYGRSIPEEVLTKAAEACAAAVEVLHGLRPLMPGESITREPPRSFLDAMAAAARDARVPVGADSYVPWEALTEEQRTTMRSMLSAALLRLKHSWTRDMGVAFWSGMYGREIGPLNAADHDRAMKTISAVVDEVLK